MALTKISSNEIQTGAVTSDKIATNVSLGGPTPQNNKPDDDSNKIDATKAAKSATAPTTKPSAASADKQDAMKKMAEEDEQKDEEIIAEKMHDDEKKEMMKKKMKEDIDALFSDDSTISKGGDGFVTRELETFNRFLIVESNTHTFATTPS